MSANTNYNQDAIRNIKPEAIKKALMQSKIANPIEAMGEVASIAINLGFAVSAAEPHTVDMSRVNGSFLALEKLFDFFESLSSDV